MFLFSITLDKEIRLQNIIKVIIIY